MKDEILGKEKDLLKDKKENKKVKIDGRKYINLLCNIKEN